MSKALLLTGLTVPLVACVALSAPIAALRGTPTPPPSSTAHPTLSPTPSPSSTPEPTETPTEAPSATPEPLLSAMPTLFLPPQTPVTAVPKKLDCRLVWQSPRNGVTFDPLETFSAGWKIMNTGSTTWDENTVEFTYLGGAKLYDDPLVRLKASVPPGQAVVLSVEMKTPRNPTRYTSYWSLREGNTFFCTLMLSIYVE
jgi:hypothetical protein